MVHGILHFVLFAIVAKSMFIDKDVSVAAASKIKLAWSGELAVGGWLNISLSLNSLDSGGGTPGPRYLSYLVCSLTQSDAFPSTTEEIMETVCLKPSSLNCDLSGRLYSPPVNQSVTINHSIQALDTYYVLTYMCDQTGYKLQVQGVAINPNGEYLDWSDVPFKLMFILMQAAWVVVALLWLFNWVRYRAFNVVLHRVCTVVPLTKMVFCTFSWLMWHFESQTGHKQTALFWVKFVLDSVSKGAFFSCLFLVSKGWGLVIAKLPRVERQQLIILAVVITMVSGRSSDNSSFFVFLVAITYFLFLRRVFASLVSMTRLLQQQLRLVKSELDDEDTIRSTPVSVKLKMFKRIQLATVSYITLAIIFHLWATIFLSQYKYIYTLLEELIDLAMVLAVGNALKMRPFNPYFVRLIGDEENRILAGEDSDLNWVNGHDISPAFGKEPLMREEDCYANGQLWRPGMPVPKIITSQWWNKRHRDFKREAVIVVENPGTGVVLAKPTSMVGTTLLAGIKPSVSCHMHNS